MLKKLLITTAAGGLMWSAALAQAPTQSDRPASPPAAAQDQASKPEGQAGQAKTIAKQNPDQWLASKFKGTDVLGSDNQKIGDVSDILFDKSGKIEAFVISVGGFLGMGAKEVALPPSAFQFTKENDQDKVKVSMNKDQLQQAANFEKYSPPRPAATTGTGTGGGGQRPAGGGGGMGR
jgi:sporulation protein YlmC with PRC-barrel domain